MYTIKNVVYPESIANRIAELRHNRSCADSDALATAANFSCGSFVRFSLSIDSQSQSIIDASFLSNGCGFMLAAADLLAERIIKSRLVDLHGLADTHLHEHIIKSLDDIPPDRHECISACIGSMRAAFADLRTKRIAEFQGEKALICTCFSVTEETIEALLSDPGGIATGFSTVEEVTEATGAGGGCGSCRMLIQEMLDTRLDNL